MQNRIIKNASWIVVCKIVQSALGLIISMFSARYLGPQNFGVINYAASIVAFALPLMQLGLRSILVNEFIQRPSSEGKILGTALGLNLLSAIACMIGIVTFVSIINKGETTTLIVCALYTLSLLFQAFEMIQYWFQAKLLSKYTSLISLLAYLVVSLYKIFLLVTQKSVYWFAMAQTIDYGIIAFFSLMIYKKLGGQELSFSIRDGSKMLSKSKHYIISGMMVTIFAQTDRLMLKNMIDDVATGYYSAAVTCAGLANFVFSAIIDSMRPVILEEKKRSQKAYETNIALLFSITFYLSLFQCICVTLFAEPIIMILFGVEYVPSISALRVVVWYVTYSYFGSVRNVWILAEEKQKYLWIINVSGALLNIVLNIKLIPQYGIIGASLASFVTQFFTNFVLGFIVKPIRDCNRLMIVGINPKFALREIKKVIKYKRGDQL